MQQKSDQNSKQNSKRGNGQDGGQMPALMGFLPMTFLSPAGFDALGWSNGLFEAAHRNMNMMFDNVLQNLPQPGLQPRADVSEDAKSLRVKMDIPGINEDDIDISADGGLLTISGEKNESKEGGASSYSFIYSTTLPEGADIKSAKVSFNNHKLSIEIPKRNGKTPAISEGGAKQVKKKHKKTRH